LMRENDLLAPRRVGSPRGPRNHDGTIIPETVDTMWGTDLTTTFTGEARRRCSSRSIIAPLHASASTPIRGQPGSRRWNQSGRACAGTSAGSPRASRAASRCGTIMDRNTCRIISRRRSGSSASKVCPPSSARPRVTAALSGSSGRSGKPAVGAPLRDDRGTAPGSAGVPRGLQHDLAH